VEPRQGLRLSVIESVVVVGKISHSSDVPAESPLSDLILDLEVRGLHSNVVTSIPKDVNTV
jgi:hypothetical protein